MAKGFELNLTGVQQLNKRLNNLSDTLKKGIQQEIEASGQNIDTAAKSNVPVNLGGGGGLKTAINHNKIENGVEIVAQKDYAAYVEFGTGTEVEVPVGLESYAMEFFVSGKGHLPAHPFLFPAYFEEKPKLIKKIEERLNKA